MDHYLDIALLPDPEFPAPILMSALFAKLHRILVQLSSTDIGVSFPVISPSHLGNVMRLHGGKQALDNLMAQSWLTGMRDHSELSGIHTVPEITTRCRVQRVQAKSNAERLRRRYQKRHSGETQETLAQRIPDGIEQRLSLPYVRLKSLSTGQDFPLFIHQHSVNESQAGTFNAYGFSQTATLPWF